MNSRIDVILVKKTYTTDAIGQRIASQEQRTVSGYVESTSLAEFSSAGEAGLKRDKRVLIWAFEYEDEDELIIGSTHYAIYRMYENADGKAELYLERRVGVDG